MSNQGVFSYQNKVIMIYSIASIAGSLTVAWGAASTRHRRYHTTAVRVVPRTAVARYFGCMIMIDDGRYDETSSLSQLKYRYEFAESPRRVMSILTTRSDWGSAEGL